MNEQGTRKRTLKFWAALGAVMVGVALLGPSRSQAQEPSSSQTQEGQERVVPQTLSLPAGTLVTVRVSDFLSSDRNKAGDGFTAELEQPVVVDGWVVARRGQTVVGRVAVAKRAGRIKGVSQLGVELTSLVLVDGQQLPVRTQWIEDSAGTSRGRDAAALGTTTGVGATIGAAASGGEGAAIGAGAGAAVGLLGVLFTRGRPTVLPPETSLTFQLQSPLTTSTERSRVAFRPVNPQDYGPGKLRRRPHLAGPPYPPTPYYYGGPYYPRPYYYPSPFFVGFHGRGFRHHRFHR
ncbi:MAG: hypothetical protein DMG21_04040 [Acidobacteria bacterium]|nr:MAG: hypothetical protein DMG21_04040 [Acidobacteriota bacterium]